MQNNYLRPVLVLLVLLLKPLVAGSSAKAETSAQWKSYVTLNANTYRVSLVFSGPVKGLPVPTKTTDLMSAIYQQVLASSEFTRGGIPCQWVQATGHTSSKQVHIAAELNCRQLTGPIFWLPAFLRAAPQGATLQTAVIDQGATAVYRLDQSNPLLRHQPAIKQSQGSQEPPPWLSNQAIAIFILLTLSAYLGAIAMERRAYVLVAVSFVSLFAATAIGLSRYSMSVENKQLLGLALLVYLLVVYRLRHPSRLRLLSQASICGLLAGIVVSQVFAIAPASGVLVDLATLQSLGVLSLPIFLVLFLVKVSRHRLRGYLQGRQRQLRFISTGLAALSFLLSYYCLLQ